MITEGLETTFYLSIYFFKIPKSFNKYVFLNVNTTSYGTEHPVTEI